MKPGSFRSGQASIANHGSGKRFPVERGFLAELGPLAALLNQCRHVRRTLLLLIIGCVGRSGKPLRRCRRTEFRDFLACPGFPLNLSLLSSGVGSTRLI